MKNLLYRIYAILFSLSALIFPLKEKRAAFVSMHNENFNDSLGEVMKQFENRGFDCVKITRRDLDVSATNIFRVFGFFFVKSRLLATSKYVFLNDNFLPMAFLKFKNDAVVTQLWHAEGAFKRFGLAIEQPEGLRKTELAASRRLSFVVCSSKAVAPVYAEAFGVRENQVLPLGAPRADYLLTPGNAEKARQHLLSLYPQLEGKQLVLYAPTFRGTDEENENILSHFDFSLFERELGEKYSLLLRLHPQVHKSCFVPPSVTDVTEFEDVRELVLACDALITDYSSICMDFCLLSKKTVFFAFDEEKYTDERSFYFDYKTDLPGERAATTAQVIEALRCEFNSEKNERFRRRNFDFIDCKSAERITEAILSKGAKI